MKQPNPHLVLATVCAGVVLVTIDMFIVNIAFPALERDFEGASVASLSWVLNAYAIVFAALLVPAGRLADRAGRKGGFMAGVAIFTGASALCAAASSIEMLVAARVLQATGGALLIPASLGLLLAAVPAERRQGAVRIWAASSGVAAALGPLAGGLLVNADWRWIFLVNVPLGIGALVAARRFLPATPAVAEPRPDLPGAFLLIVAVAAITLGLVKAPEWGWASVSTVAAFAAGLAVLATFLRRSAGHASPVVEMALFRVRPFAVSTLAMLIVSAAFAAMLLSVLVWAQTAWGWSALRTGVAFAPGPLMVPLFSIAAGRLAGRVGPGLLTAVGAAFFATGALSWAVSIGAEADYVSAMLPGVIATGIGVGLTVPTLTATAAASLPPQRFATGSAVVSMARQLGYVLGVAILVAVLGTPTAAGRLDAFQRGWIVVAALALLAIPAAALFSERMRLRVAVAS
jgi:EmrB/QacA subfamily drug resistance transporter